MNQLKKNILACLQELKGSGEFVSTGSADFVFPGVAVKGVGEIAFPLNEQQAKALIKSSHKAPFGKGNQTFVDKNVRSGWEIDADDLQFNNPDWKSFLKKIIKNVQKDLGLGYYTVHAEPYKLLIYEKGDFFLPHRDSEKEKGMFGTLIIGLPSYFTGGVLHIRFEGKEEIADFSDPAFRHSLQYTAFYADCEHEVKPLTSGYRMSLVYNLIQKENSDKIETPSIQNQVDSLGEIFRNDICRNNSQPYIILLGHQYTPENFSKNTLKLNDRFRAKALIMAAKELGYYSNLCLVTSYLMGAPEYDGYYGDDADDVLEMGEIYDDELSIEKWLTHENPALNQFHFREEDLITSFPVNDGEPIVQENSGYMGNYGPEVMYWYHYGAVVMWSPETNADLLLLQNVKTQLEWIHYFVQTEKINKKEIEAVSNILSHGLNDRYFEKENFNVVADWLIKQNNQTFFVKISREQLQLYFDKIDAEHWIKLFNFIPFAVSERIFEKLMEEITKPVLEKLIALLKLLHKEEKLYAFSVAQINLLPNRFVDYYTKTAKGINRNALSNLFVLGKTQFATESWSTRIVETMSANLDREYVHNILAIELLTTKTICDLTEKLNVSCQEYLQKRVADQPQPLADWIRPVPDAINYRNQWKILRDFLESPDAHIFDYSIRKEERDQMEDAICSVEIDLRAETIRKGSPHTLRIIKTQSSYEKAQKKWQKDVELLNRMKTLGLSNF